MILHRLIACCALIAAMAVAGLEIHAQEAPPAAPAENAPPLVAPAEPAPNVPAAAANAPEVAPNLPEAAPLPLIEQDPFDQITVDADNGGGTFRVFPAAFPNRKVPVAPSLETLLTVRMFDDPETEAQIAWRHIAKVQLYEELLLAEAQRLAAAQKFEEAFEYFELLHELFPNLPGLTEATRDFRYRNAGALFRQQRYVEALALLEEVSREEPTRAGVAAALANVSQPLFESYLKEDRFDAARLLAVRTAQRRDEASLALAQSWHTRLATDARAQERLAQQQFGAGNYRDANEAARRMLTIWPELPGGRALFQKIAERWPMIRVSVGQTSPTMVSRFPLERAARRIASVSELTPAALDRFGPDGAVYASPLGQIAAAENRRSISLRSASLSGYEISQRLLAAAAAGSENYDPLWASLLKSATVDDVYQVRIELHRPCPLPLAMLTSASIAANFNIASTTAEQADYIGGQAATGPKEIIERVAASPAAALADLRRGRVDMIERITPGEAKSLAADSAIRVGRYAVPSVHLLVPNASQPYAANSTFRRALAYAIPRGRILTDELLGKTESVDCRTISGPFPTGDAQAGWSYAYDNTIAPLTYEPRIALTLLRVAEDEISRASQKQGNVKPQRQSIVIGHSSDAIHRVACDAIVEQLKRIGIPCERKDLSVSEASAASDCDFWYVELTLEEPGVDAVRLFGEHGLVKPSPFVTLAVRDVMNATNLQQASDQLHALHRAIHAEQTVIPLWQLVDHFAYRADLSGVDDQIVTLYRNIDRWQFAAESPIAAAKP